MFDCDNFGANRPMGDAAARRDLHQIRDWLLAILRFAVTLEQADLAAVLAKAEEMDRLGMSTAQSKFAFFARTSIKFCEGIVAKHGSSQSAALRHYVSEIDDVRLRRAIAAVLEIRRSGTTPFKSRSRNSEGLFRGLPPTTGLNSSKGGNFNLVRRG